MLAGKVILITGAASGIGAAAAHVFAGYGAKLLLTDRDGAGVAAVAGDIDGAVGLGADITSETDMAAAVAAAAAHFGSFDGAFNNAGVEQAGAAMIPAGDYPLADFDRVVAVNLRGLLVSLRAEIPAMRRGGAIVNTASVMAVRAAPGMGAYAASKHGVLGLTRAAALDHAAAGIRINALLPGAVRTPMLTERAFPANPGYEQHATAAHPLGRLAEPQEIAEAAAWLLSDRASFVTGAALAVDGGMTAG